MQWPSCEGGPSGESFGCSGIAVRGVLVGSHLSAVAQL